MTDHSTVEQAQSVRERLLDAADQIVARDGVANFTLEAVAREAGVSKGGLLYHFPSKSALIAAIIERLGQRREREQDQALAKEPDPACPGAFTRAYLLSRIDLPDPEHRPLLTALLAAVATDPNYLEPLVQRVSQWQARLENDGIDPACATIVRLAIDGWCLGALLGAPVPTGALRQKVLDKLIELTRPNSSNG